MGKDGQSHVVAWDRTGGIQSYLGSSIAPLFPTRIVPTYVHLSTVSEKLSLNIHLFFSQAMFSILLTYTHMMNRLI